MLRIAMVQFRARAVRSTNSIARWFATGNVPGNPRQIGQTRVLGSPPNATGQRQNILDWVLNSAWTSMPTLATKLGIEIASLPGRIGPGDFGPQRSRYLRLRIINTRSAMAARVVKPPR